MNVSALSEFVEKASLNGLIKRILLEGEAGWLKCRAMTADKELVVEMSRKVPRTPTFKAGVLAKTFLKSLTAFKPESECRLRMPNSVQLIVEDKEGTRANIPTIDPDTIPKPSEVKGTPTFSFCVVFGGAALRFFRKASKGHDCFTFQRSGEKLEIRYGWVPGENNTYLAHRPEFKGTLNELKEPIAFSSKAFNLVVRLNDQAESFRFEVDTRGIARIDLSHGDNQQRYWLATVPIDGTKRNMART